MLEATLEEFEQTTRRGKNETQCEGNDRDGVPDIVDCKPHDKKRQGWVHEKWKKFKRERAYKRAAEAQIRKKAKEARYKAREEQEIRYAQEKEKIKTDIALRQRRKGGIVGQFVSGFKRPAPKKVYVGKRRKKKKGKRRREVREAPRRKSLAEHMSQYKF